MTVEEVKALLRQELAVRESLPKQAIAMEPVRGDVILRGADQDEVLPVWLVGEAGGYRVVLRDDGSVFGLATAGFSGDKYPVLVGWYGDLKTALACM